MDNFYNILEVEPTATKSEIKKAYRKLVIKYHPDKSDDPLAKEKFQQVQAAYEILSDDSKRKDYDGLTKEERMQVFDIIKMYFKEINPSRAGIYDTILNALYENKEDVLRDDINSFDIKSIFGKIINKVIINKLKKEKDNISIIDHNYNIHITLEEKYKGDPKYIKIEDSKYTIPIINDSHKILHNNEFITINIKCENTANFEIINTYDILNIRKVSLSQYLYGGKIKISYFNNENIFFEFDCCLEKKPIFILENKGLLKDINTRGNLYIYLTIDGINDIQGANETSYAKTMKETLKLMFPPFN